MLYCQRGLIKKESRVIDMYLDSNEGAQILLRQIDFLLPSQNLHSPKMIIPEKIFQFTFTP